MSLTYDPVLDGQKITDLTFAGRYGALNNTLNELQLAGPGYAWDIEQQTGAISMSLDGLGMAANSGYNENGAENTIFNNAELFTYMASPYALGFTIENLSMDMDWGDNRALNALFDNIEMAGPGFAWDIEQQTGSISRVLDNLAFVGSNGWDEATENRAEAFVRNHAETFVYNADLQATGFAMEQFSMDADAGDIKTLDVMLDTVEMAGPGFAWDIEQNTGSISRTLDNLGFVATAADGREDNAERLIRDHAETFVYNSDLQATGFTMEQLSMDMDGGDAGALRAMFNVVQQAGPGFAWDIEQETGSISRTLDNLGFIATAADAREDRAEAFIRDFADEFVFNADVQATGFTLEQLSMDGDKGDRQAASQLLQVIERAGPGFADQLEWETGAISRTLDNFVFHATAAQGQEDGAENFIRQYADLFARSANPDAIEFGIEVLRMDGDAGDRRAANALEDAFEDYYPHHNFDFV